MPVYYMDTSIILKRYRDEQDSEVVERLLSESGSDDRFYTSFLSVLEVRAGMSRLVRGGQLDRDFAGHLLAMFHEDSQRILQL